MSISPWQSYTKDNVLLEFDEIGVYELRDASFSTVYYGSGKVRTRLLDHLNKRECPTAKYYVIHMRGGTEAECRAKEEQLLADYQRRHGKLPMYNERIG